jgi:hypothetical protein
MHAVLSMAGHEPVVATVKVQRQGMLHVEGDWCNFVCPLTPDDRDLLWAHEPIEPTLGIRIRLLAD